MRALLLIGAVLAAAACSPAATAQPGADFAGTWAFQTRDYGNPQVVVAMSGTAVMTPSAPGRYNIQLLSQELVSARGGGRSEIITARQTCVGEMQGAQFDISCEMAEPLEGYQPDNFVLQEVEADKLEGVLSSAATGQVTFTRLR